MADTGSPYNLRYPLSDDSVAVHTDLLNLATDVTEGLDLKLNLAGGTLTGGLSGTSAAFSTTLNVTGVSTLAGGINLAGVADTNSQATHYFTEIGTDGYIRPKALADVKTEIVTTTAVNSAAATVLGTVTSGTWNGSTIAGQYGGTGVANTGKTITLGGNLETSGAYNLTATLTGNTSITLPTSGTIATTADVSAAYPGRNLLHNGAFNVNQRGFTSNTSDGTYNYDRWKQWNNGGTLTITPQQFTLGNAIEGQEPKQYVQCVTASHTASSHYAIYTQPIEGVRTLAGQTATLSFWAKAGSGTPKIGINPMQRFGTGGSPSTAVSTQGGTVTLSTSWQRYSVTFTLPSISGKTLGTTAGTDYLDMRFMLSAGSDLDAQSGAIGNQNNTFSLWGIQLETGSVQTPFEHKDYGQELAECQRYCYVKTTTNGAPICMTYPRDVSTAWTIFDFPVTMRVAPNLAASSDSTFHVMNLAGTTVTTSPTVGQSLASTSSSLVSFDEGLVYTVGQTLRVAAASGQTAVLTWSADL